MAEEQRASYFPPFHRREAIKCSVHSTAVHRRKQQTITLGRERREALIRTKRLRRDLLADSEYLVGGDMVVDEDKTILYSKTAQAVEDLKTVLSLQGRGAAQKKIDALRALRSLLSKSELPPIEAAIQAGAVPILAQFLSFGAPDEQLLEASWCLTNIAAGEAEQTKALLPALPMLIAHLGEKSSALVAEQCAWALGNVAGEGEELRKILLSQGALLPLSRLMLSSRGSAARTAAWALSNLIKGPDAMAANELIKIDHMLGTIIKNLEKADDELATEVAWVIVYLTAVSEKATSLLVRSSIIELLVSRLVAVESLQLLIPVLRCLGNIIAGDSSITDTVLVVGQDITDQLLSGLVKCLKSDHRVLKKEASWVLSNIAAGNYEHKKLIFISKATPLLIQHLLSAPFDIKREAAYTLGNLCVAPAKDDQGPSIIVEHLVSLVTNGCLTGFVNLIRSAADVESARLGLQFLEMVMRGYPNGEGPKLVERADGIEAMERFQFHENEEIRNMANGLVDKYFGEDYGLD